MKKKIVLDNLKYPPCLKVTFLTREEEILHNFPCSKCAMRFLPVKRCTNPSVLTYIKEKIEHLTDPYSFQRNKPQVLILRIYNQLNL